MLDVVGVEEAGSASLEKLSGLNIDAKAAFIDGMMYSDTEQLIWQRFCALHQVHDLTFIRG